MRKVIAATILAVAAALPASAAYQYEIDGDGLRIKENIALSIRFPADSASRGLDRFGLLVRSPGGENQALMLDLATSPSGREFRIGNFTAGDRLDFFTASGDNTLVDQLVLSETDGSVAFLRISDSRTGESVDIRLAGGIYGDGPDPDRTIPAGQPLPGVLAALLLGGGSWGLGKFKRRKQPEPQDGTQS